MVLSSALLAQIPDGEVMIRTLKPSDVSKEYVAALARGRKYIRAAQWSKSLCDQKQFVEKIREHNQDTILGFFLKGVLIGTSGVQQSYSNSLQEKLQVTSNQVFTSVGIIIFPESLRGRSLGHCLLYGACLLYKYEMDVECFAAEIDSTNDASLSLFQKCGFVVEGFHRANQILVANKDRLVPPNHMSNITITKDALYE